MTDPNPLRTGLRIARTPEPCTVVIFGATGDLTARKLLPALYNLAKEGLVPGNIALVGEHGLEILTADPAWPTEQVDGRARPLFLPAF